MKTIKFIAAAVVCLLSLTANAQSMKVYQNGELKAIYYVSKNDKVEFSDDFPFPDQEDNKVNGHEYVDLGLSVKWANMNIGATSMEDYGDYFAWGETSGYKSGKRTFDTSTYKYYKSTNGKDKDGFDVVLASGYTKYVTKSNASSHGYDGFYDDKTVLDPEDDAAIANWGGSWRMPTRAEQDELRTKCTWEWKELNGKKGYKVTGPNGNFIFLPAAGYCNVSSLYNNAGSVGNYWSSSLHTSYSGDACSLGFNSSDVLSSNGNRNVGRSVRAVCP